MVHRLGERGLPPAHQLERHFHLDWRWRMGRRLAEERTGRVRTPDRWLLLAVRLARWRSGGPARGLAAVRQALQIHEQNSWPRWLTEAGLLSGEPAQGTARAGVSAEVADAYEALFYEVRSRFSFRDHLALRALPRRAALGVNPSDTGGLLRLAAWKGGPLALDVAAKVLRQDRPAAAPPPRTGAELQERVAELNCRFALLLESLPLRAFWPPGLHALRELSRALAGLTAEVEALSTDGQVLPQVVEQVELLGDTVGQLWAAARAA